MDKGNVSIYFVRSALEAVVARGIDPAALLRRAGIAPVLLQSSQSRVTAHNFSTLWRGVALALDDELFNQDSRRMKPGSFAMLCQGLIHCATLRLALLQMARFFNLILDDFQCALEVDHRHAHLVIRETTGRAPHVFGVETLLMMQHGVACWLVGRRIAIRSATFAYPEPSRSAEYQRMYSDQLCFDADATRLSFEHSHLDLPVVQNRDSLKDFLRGAPANIVLKYKNTTGLSAQIRRRLRTAARTEWPDFDVVADSLHMTPSTLRRRLDEEGQTFQTIKDQLRRDMAVDFLCHTERSMADIAGDLGFAEASAFHRAFKKWTGASPGQYRQRVHAQ